MIKPQAFLQSQQPLGIAVEHLLPLLLRELFIQHPMEVHSRIADGVVGAEEDPVRPHLIYEMAYQSVPEQSGAGQIQVGGWDTFSSAECEPQPPLYLPDGQPQTAAGEGRNRPFDILTVSGVEADHHSKLLGKIQNFRRSPGGQLVVPMVHIGDHLANKANALPVQLLQLFTGLSGKARVDVHAWDIGPLVLLPQAQRMAVHLPIGRKAAVRGRLADHRTAKAADPAPAGRSEMNPHLPAWHSTTETSPSPPKRDVRGNR